MVLQDTLDNLRARPKQERTAIAAWISIGIVAVLLIIWLVYFFHSIAMSTAQLPPNATTTPGANGLQNAQQQFQQATGSSTQFVQTQGSEQLEPTSTSSASQATTTQPIQINQQSDSQNQLQ